VFRDFDVLAQSLVDPLDEAPIDDAAEVVGVGPRTFLEAPGVNFRRSKGSAERSVTCPDVLSVCPSIQPTRQSLGPTAFAA
jgi:hypothetical protein